MRLWALSAIRRRMEWLAGPCAHGMKIGGFAAVAPTQCFAVDGDLSAFHGEAELAEVGGNAGGENGRVDGLEDARKGVVGRNAVGEL